jgi:hypothetical protein
MGSWRRGVACCALALALTAVTATVTGCSDDPGGDTTDTQFTATTTPPAGSGAATGATGQPPLEIPTVGVGERVTGAGYELVVHEVTAPAPAPGPTAAPGPGNMLMSVDVELVNRTASERDATYLRLNVVDSTGARYKPSPAGEALPAGWIAADVPERVRLLYEVPISATDLVLTLQPDLVSTVAAAVHLR